MAKIARPPSPLARRHPFEPAQDEAPAAAPTENAAQLPTTAEGAVATTPVAEPTAPSTAKSGRNSKTQTPTQAPQPSDVEPKKKSVGIWMPQADQDRLRAVYRATIGTEGYASFSDFALRALLKEAALLEQRYNNGEQWEPVSPGTLPTGRPLG